MTGIDFGTANSAIGLLNGDGVQIVPNAGGAFSTPSIVAITADGQLLAGAAAKRQASQDPIYTVAAAKRRLGTGWSIERAGARYNAEDVCAVVLARLRADAEAYTGGSVAGAVITAPSSFTYAQRCALRNAAKKAGIPVSRIINDSAAASLSYALNRAAEENILVADLGAGTLDVTLLQVSGGTAADPGVCEVIATAGDSHLGGSDWDRQLADYLLRLTCEHYGQEVSAGAEAMQRLADAAETARTELSSSPATHIRLPYLAETPAGPAHLDTTLLRSELEAATANLLRRCQAPISQVIRDAAVNPSDVSRVVLTGGATRMPAVAALIQQAMGGTPPHRGLQPHAVAAGATVQAGILTGNIRHILPLDVNPISVGIETAGGAFVTMIARNVTVPTRRSEIFTTGRHDQQNLTIHVLEGEHQQAEQDSPLAVLELPGLTSAPPGIPQVEVSIDLDANGILSVTARDLDGSATRSVTVDSVTLAAMAEYRRTEYWLKARADLPAHL
jgi:molecular chaperone DnaK